MTTEEAVRLTRAHIERQFPKTCRNCGVTFGSLSEYLLQTHHVGQPISYDEELGDKKPKEPIGTASFANCKCGTTLAITSEGMNIVTMWRLMAWARGESKRRGISWRAVMAWVRGEIDRQALSQKPGGTRTSRPRNI